MGGKGRSQTVDKKGNRGRHPISGTQDLGFHFLNRRGAGAHAREANYASRFEASQHFHRWRRKFESRGFGTEQTA